jgi:hypothetical protein
MLVLAYKMLEHPRVPARVTGADSFATQRGEDDRL